MGVTIILITMVEGGVNMDIKYIPKGEEGKSCADCKHFERDSNMQGMGKCFGKEVLAGGSCNFFEPKE